MLGLELKRYRGWRCDWQCVELELKRRRWAAGAAPPLRCLTCLLCHYDCGLLDDLFFLILDSGHEEEETWGFLLDMGWFLLKTRLCEWAKFSFLLRVRFFHKVL